MTITKGDVITMTASGLRFTVLSVNGEVMRMQHISPGGRIRNEVMYVEAVERRIADGRMMLEVGT